jgi:hypothetical protein
MARMNGAARARRVICLLAAALFIAIAQPNYADAGWFESGDTRLRLDLQLLADAEIIRLPVNQWPMPRAAVRYAMASARDQFATNAAVQHALERVRQRLDAARPGWSPHVAARAGSAGLWRDFDTLGREDGEIEGGLRFDSERISVTAVITGAGDPADDRALRADGSQATLALGNWLFSAHMLDRWWGPGQQGSLILSNNARPMPTVVVERAEPRPFESRWLNWLGPWRFSLGFSRMESERADIDEPLFMAWRVVVMPFKKIELGFSRTAQFCGKGQRCDLNTFGNLLAGNDNVGIDARPGEEPGNQMAGFDIRWSSPLGELPYAIYAQAIGEDESSYLPAKYIMQYGLETWKPLADGGIVQLFAEYATTTCSASTSRGPYYNCAYNQGKFNQEGYRYHGRVIGYSSDRDAENYSLGGTVTTDKGVVWTAAFRRSRFNRDDFDDVRNPVSSVPADYHALELGWKGSLGGQPVSVDLGYERKDPVIGATDAGVFGFVGWRHEFGR